MVLVAPIIPGLTDHEMPAILAAAREAGAIHAGYVMLRLPYGLPEIFAQWLADHYPERRERVWSRLREVRGGRDNDARFGLRHARRRADRRCNRDAVSPDAQAARLSGQAVALRRRVPPAR